MSSFTYPKNKRLLASVEFKTVFDNTAFKIHQPCFILFIQTKPNIPHSRLGLAITKKKVKKASQRNRLKRLTREYFRQHQHQFVQSIDMILTVKTLPKETSNQQIFEQLQQAFVKINQKLQPHNRCVTTNVVIN